MTRKEGKVNVDRLAKQILGIPLGMRLNKMSDVQRKNFHAVKSVFRGRGYTADHWSMGCYKTGKGMKLIEKFVFGC